MGIMCFGPDCADTRGTAGCWDGKDRCLTSSSGPEAKSAEDNCESPDRKAEGSGLLDGADFSRMDGRKGGSWASTLEKISEPEGDVVPMKVRCL